MTTIGQSVIKSTSNVTAQIASKTSAYIFALLFTVERKNYTSMARSSGKSYDEIYVNRTM